MKSKLYILSAIMAMVFMGCATFTLKDINASKQIILPNNMRAAVPEGLPDDVFEWEGQILPMSEVVVGVAHYDPKDTEAPFSIWIFWVNMDTGELIGITRAYNGERTVWLMQEDGTIKVSSEDELDDKIDLISLEYKKYMGV